MKKTRFLMAIFLLFLPILCYADFHSGDNLVVQLHQAYSAKMEGDNLNVILAMGDELFNILLRDFNVSTEVSVGGGGGGSGITFQFVNYTSPYDDFIKIQQDGYNTYKYSVTIETVDITDEVYFYYMVNCGMYERLPMYFDEGEWHTFLKDIPLNSIVHYVVVAKRKSDIITTYRSPKIMEWDLPRFKDSLGYLEEKDLIAILFMILLLVILALVFYSNKRNRNI